MSKEKKNRFYYSKKQNDLDENMWSIPTRFTFVKTPNGWKQYSEWCSTKGVKCNWEDAELVYATDDAEPEIIIHEGIPKFIDELQEEVKQLKKQLSKYKSYKTTDEQINDLTNLYSQYKKENNKLKQQLAESENEIERLKSKEKKIRLHTKRDWFERCCRLEDESIILGLENEELKQQLAGKEKEVESLNNNWNVLCDYLGESIVKYDEEDFSGIYSEILNKVNEIQKYDYKYNQDKISFVVERLEKVKDFAIDYIEFKDEYQENWLYEFIDNQIKELNKEK